MKKILLASLLALPLLAVSQQRASAWCQFKFGVGLNLEGSSGGNCLAWGLWKSDQPPPPAGYGFGPGMAGGDLGGYGMIESEPAAPSTPAPMPKEVKPAVYNPVVYYYVDGF
jgi:hypothetical protein